MGAQIERMVQKFRAARGGRVDPRWARLCEALEVHPAEGRRVVVFGSMEPIVEAILLAYGAAHITTVEYNRLTYDHPQLVQLRPSELPGAGLFDLGVSLSSFDHDGLGRYGDPVNPEGDLLAMVAAHRALLGD